MKPKTCDWYSGRHALLGITIKFGERTVARVSRELIQDNPKLAEAYLCKAIRKAIRE